MEAMNNHPQASQLVTTSLANYHEGGNGIVRSMKCLSLTTGEPYEIDGQTQITPLGHATAEVRFPYSPPDQASPDLIYQALQHGSAGNSLGIRYTTSADPALYGSGVSFQDRVSIGYETMPNGDQIVVVHLATTSLPSCPDAETDRAAYDEWQKLYPVYSCTSSRAVLSTAGDVLQALVKKNLENPNSALVWASMDFKDEGWDSTAKVGPTAGTIWLSGGDDALREEDYGIGLKFIPDGTAMQVGDIFQVGVGWYNGDEENLDINAMNNYRNTMNLTGDQILGANGASDNVLDSVQRLYWGLMNNDSELIGKELPKLKEAIEKITTTETNVGTRIIRNQFVLNNLEQNKYATESTLSAIEDADFTRLITDLKNAQLIYEAVLGTTGLTTKLSLLNYI
jgi:flagellin-like hook-associated protein FlgL